MAQYSNMFLIVLLINIISSTISLPQGAPEKVCSTMLPFHGGGITPSKSVSPFQIVPSSSFIGQEQSLKIDILGFPQGISFSGFMIQAKNVNPPHEIIGQFSSFPEGSIKLLNCNNSVNNSATHNNPDAKSIVSLEWRSSYDFLGKVVFNSTIAQTYDIFWVGVLSSPVQIVKREIAPAVIGISTTRAPLTSTKKMYIPQRDLDAPLIHSDDPFYNNCSRSKTCFGFPDGCIKSKSCTAMVAATVRGDIYEFELKSTSSQMQYVALGLSSDQKMGNDLVTECVMQSDRVALYTSLTSGAPNYGTTRIGVPQISARLLESSVEDGKIYCRVQRNIVTTVQDQMFDLMNNKYYLLLALGSNIKDNGVDYHDIGRIVSINPISLSEVQDITGSSNTLLRIHGAFMITAWIGTTSIGILLARYFKRTWVGSQTCGKDEWFAWHRICMMITWSLTIIAFVIIFIEIGGWSTAQNAHATFGTVTTFLCFIQPIGAFLRPGPNSKNRIIFNWLHWLGGNLAHIFSLITIFFAVKLSKAELPLWMDWILVSYVIMHFVGHILFSIAACISDRQGNKRVNSFPMGEMSNNRMAFKSEEKINAPFERFRKYILSIYVVLLILFVTALDIIVSFAPIERTFGDFKNRWVK